MPASPRQGSLFEQPAPAGRDNEPAELALNVQQLQSWQQRIHSFQSPLFQADGASQEQASLFILPADSVEPRELRLGGTDCIRAGLRLHGDHGLLRQPYPGRGRDGAAETKGSERVAELRRLPRGEGDDG